MTTKGTGWAWLGLALGGAASLAGNVEHTYLSPHPRAGAVISALFWPIALLVCVEIVVRVRASGLSRLQRAARAVAVSVVAGFAAYISYGHLCGLLAAYGYDRVGAHAGPLAVDGLMLVASMTLSARRTPPAPAQPADVQVEDVRTPDTLPSWVDGLPDIAPDTTADITPDKRTDKPARKPRTVRTSGPVRWDKGRAVRLIASGRPDAEIARTVDGLPDTDAGRKAVSRLRADLSTLDPSAFADKHGVHPNAADEPQQPSSIVKEHQPVRTANEE